MRYRALGSTGLRVSEIGFGAWGIGGATPGATSYGPTSDAESRRAVERALDLGVTFFDTAPLYGDGRSERILGETLPRRRTGVVLATKVGRRSYVGEADFAPEAMRRSLEQSLSRLRTDAIDLLQLHNPPVDRLHPDGEVLSTLRRFQEEGLVRTLGLSAGSPAEARIAIEELGIPVVQVNFNLLDQRVLAEGLDEAARRADAALIARTPLCFGVLTLAVDASTEFAAEDHRSVWPREQIARWAEAGRAFLEAVAERDGQTPAQVALRFCLSSPAVATTIPGMLTAEQVEENAVASGLGPLSPGEMLALARLYRSRAPDLAPRRGRDAPAGSLAR